jgi:hypothetical protein
MKNIKIDLDCKDHPLYELLRKEEEKRYGKSPNPSGGCLQCRYPQHDGLCTCRKGNS